MKKAKFCAFGYFSDLQYGCMLYTNYGTFQVMSVDGCDIVVIDDNSDDFTFDLREFKRGEVFFTK